MDTIKKDMSMEKKGGGGDRLLTRLAVLEDFD